MARRAVGVDLDGRHAAVAELARHGGQARLVRWAVQEIDEPTDAGRGAALARAMRAAGISGRKVICAVPRADATVKWIRLPADDRETIRKMLTFEAQQHVPFPLAEVAWDFDLCPDGSVLLVAARKALLEGLRAALGRAGLEPAGVSVTSAATASAYEYARAQQGEGEEESEQAVVVLELNAGPVIVNVLRGGRWRFSRPLTLRGDEMLSAPDAGGAEWMHTLRAEVERSLLAAAEGAPALALDRVVATGPGAQTPGLLEGCSKALGLSVTAFESPFEGAPAALDTAVGLALQGLGLARGVNLLSAAAASAQRKTRRLVSSVAAVLVLVAALGLGTWRYWALEKQALALQPQRAAWEQREKEMNTLRARERVLSARLAELERLRDSRHEVLRALKALSAAAPQGVWLTSMSHVSGRAITVQGRAPAAGDVTRLLDALGSEAALSYVKQGEDAVDFAITMDVGGPRSSSERGG